MAALATPEQLAGFVGSDVDTYQAQQALGVASGAIRAECGWSISAESVVGAVVEVPSAGSVWLPTMHLTGVSAVAEGGSQLVADVDYVWSADGRLRLFGSRGLYSWPLRPRLLTVSYAHGWSAVPDAVVGVCLGLAAKTLNNPGGELRSHSESVGAVSETRVFSAANTGQASFLSDGDRRDLAPFKLVYVA